jgi:hypothetical protein
MVLKGWEEIMAGTAKKTTANKKTGIAKKTAAAKKIATAKIAIRRNAKSLKPPELERIKIGITLQRRWADRGDELASAEGVTLSFWLDRMIEWVDKADQVAVAEGMTLAEWMDLILE